MGRRVDGWKKFDVRDLKVDLGFHVDGICFCLEEDRSRIVIVFFLCFLFPTVQITVSLTSLDVKLNILALMLKYT